MGKGLVGQPKGKFQKVWQEPCSLCTSEQHTGQGAREISRRPHSGFAPNSLRQHLNTWCAYGHNCSSLQKFALPQACWSVLSWKKKNVFGITEFLGKCQLSHPLSLELAGIFSLLSTQFAVGPILGNRLFVEGLLFLSC